VGRIRKGYLTDGKQKEEKRWENKEKGTESVKERRQIESQSTANEERR